MSYVLPLFFYISLFCEHFRRPKVSANVRFCYTKGLTGSGSFRYQRESGNQLKTHKTLFRFTYRASEALETSVVQFKSTAEHDYSAASYRHAAVTHFFNVSVSRLG